MKSLIVEDEFTSRVVLQRVLTRFGECHIAVNGEEAIRAFIDAREKNAPYQLVCMDILLPGMSGIEAVSRMRAAEEQRGIYSNGGVKIRMTTAVEETEDVVESFKALCDAYLIKPIDAGQMLHRLQFLGLIP